MTHTEILARQTADAYEWVNKVITSIPHDKWHQIPDVVESSVAWQVGHLILSYYYHSVMVIAGHQMDILQQIPLKEYNELYNDASPKLSAGKIAPAKLHQQLTMMEQKSLEIIRSLAAADLDKPLEPTPIKHPIAAIKFEALDWNIKHTMWHCGQLGMLKRIMHERYDFGMKKNS